MTKKLRAKITRLSEDTWRVVERQTASAAKLPLPVSLANYAKDLGIRRIRFEPLISDAGLAKNGKELEILVNTDAPRITYTHGVAFSVDDGKWLDFGSSLRFTVAHEIAHAAFLNTAGWDNRSDLAQKNRNALEKGCNILARILLLPRQLLTREIGDRPFDVEHISNLLSTFRVSPEVFIRRLNLSDMRWESTDLDGFLAFAQEREGRIRVRTCHILGAQAIARFHRALEATADRRIKPTEYQSLSDNYKATRWALEGMALNEVKLEAERNKDIEYKLRSSKNGKVELNVGWGGGDLMPCELRFHCTNEKSLSFLVSVRIIGPLQKKGPGELL